MWRAFHDQTESVGPSKRFDFDSASGFSFTSDEDPEDVAEIAKTVVSQIAGQQRKASAQADADEGVRTDLEAGLAELIRPSRPGGKAK